MSLIDRLMDKRNRPVISNLAQKKGKPFDDAEKAESSLYKNGAYTNGIQGS